MWVWVCVCVRDREREKTPQKTPIDLQIDRKEGNVYLMTHSTHFELWLYGVGHMVKDHSDSKRGNPLPSLHGLLFQIIVSGFYI